MQRAKQVIPKLDSLLQQAHHEAIDIDLMLDYIRVIYADLLEARTIAAPAVVQSPPAATLIKENISTVIPVMPAAIDEPTLNELAEALAADDDEQETIAAPQPIEQGIPQPFPIINEPMPEDNSFEQAPSALPQPQLVPTAMPEEPVAAVPPPPLPLNAPQLNDVRSYIGINEKYQYISELFGDNPQAYEIAISQLNNLPHYDAAAEFIGDEISWNYGWQEEDKTVVQFHETLQRFYAAR